MLINKREKTGLKYLSDLKAFIEYSNDMDDIHNNIEESNSFNSIKVRAFLGKTLKKSICAVMIRIIIIIIIIIGNLIFLSLI